MNLNLNRNRKLGSLTSRYFENEHDLQGMQDMLMEARSRTDDWHYAHIGELIFGFFIVACHLNPQEFIRLWHDDKKLVGYLILSEDPNFDFQVLPEYEWCGIENEAMEWAEMRISKLCELNPQQWGGKCVSGARQDNVKRINFLEKHGFRSGGEFSEVNMLRSLVENIPETILPVGYQVRTFDKSEGITNRAGAHRQVWHPWTVGNVSDDNYLSFMQLPGYYRNLDVVAIAPDGIISSYVNGWIDTVNRIGNLGPVGTRPDYRRKGLSRAVLSECLRRMQSYGMSRVCVSTGITNSPAVKLYESLGFKIVNKYIEYIQS
jgi:ribosomal protein S18 acetylase RimI-like enzyme